MSSILDSFDRDDSDDEYKEEVEKIERIGKKKKKDSKKSKRTYRVVQVTWKSRFIAGCKIIYYPHMPPINWVFTYTQVPELKDLPIGECDFNAEVTGAAVFTGRT